MTEEPYRWLEAMQNRREYIEDQLRLAAPVVIIHGAPGILLLTLKASTPKLFEIYDHLALGALGHPADIEKVRQVAIDTAHLEGFARSPQDVSSRRLVNYSLAPALKNAFEQIYSAPLMVRGLLAEIGKQPMGDHAWILDYDGAYAEIEPLAFSRGMLISGSKKVSDFWKTHATKIAVEPLNSWPELARQALKILLLARDAAEPEAKLSWEKLPAVNTELLALLKESRLEAAVLDRRDLASSLAYRIPSWVELELIPS